MKKLIKSLTPPLLWDKIQYIRNYKHFVKYKKLVAKNIELKDIHKGKRCFILGSGPSIKKENLKPLKNEIVFALNNFYVHEDFAEIMSGDVPKYYMTAPIHPPQSEDEWKRWFEDMESHMPKDTNMLFGLNAYDGNIKYIFEKYGIFKEHKINWYFAGVDISKDYVFFTRDIDFVNPIWSASTVSTYSLLSAIYMGFDEIYLLGVDHNYICLKKEENFRFYKSAIHQQNEHERMKFKKSDEFFGTARVFIEKELIAENCQNSKIFNCSSESLLNMFEYKNLGEIIK